MVLCWLYSYYANLYISRERILLDTIIFVTGIVQLLCLPDCPEQMIFFCISPVIWLKKIEGHCGRRCYSTDLSVRWAERLEYEATKQIITKTSTANYNHCANQITIKLYFRSFLSF